jgi:Zn-dependent membrane protease YugP
MHILFLVVIVLLLVFAPGLWVQRVMARYSEPANRYGESGGELARTLLDSLNLKSVEVEATDQGDHYDPQTKTVRLTPDKFSGHSLTAITVAAHEVGHAVQDATGFKPLKWRTRLVRIAGPGERLGAMLLAASPFISLLTRTPAAGLLTFAGGVLVMGLSTLIHLMTLPTELDASFVRALPMLAKGGVLRPGDERHARKLLLAAALTYVAGSLMSLLNVARWIAILRR